MFHKGRKHSKETKRKMSLAHKGRIYKPHSEESKCKMSLSHKGIVFSDEHKRKLSESHKGHVPSEETRRKMSKSKEGNRNNVGNKNALGHVHSRETRCKFGKSIACLIAEGKFHPGCGGKHGYFFSKKNNDNIFYASSYELAAFQILERLSKVKSYRRCPYYLPYKMEDGSQHHYVPDILVVYTDGTEEVLEIKNKYRAKSKMSVAKFKAAIKFFEDKNINFSVWTEKELNITV